MSQIISVLSQKGGVGKSTIVRALTVFLEKKGYSCKIADFDFRQKTVNDWNCTRMENDLKPSIDVQVYSDVKKAIKDSKGYDFYIIDGAGVANEQTLAIALKSDYIILPSGLSRDDLKPQIELAYELTDKSINEEQLMFILSRTNSSAAEIREAKKYVQRSGFDTIGHIPEKTSISQSHDQGLSAHETAYDSINNIVKETLEKIYTYVKK